MENLWSNKEIGTLGEAAAGSFLKEKGYQILQKNYSVSAGEIDIIAEKEDTVVFVEVKTRSSDKFGAPEESVNEAKENNLMKAAEAYIEEKDIDMECRFDIVSIIMGGNSTVSIEHFEHAFTPTA